MKRISIIGLVFVPLLSLFVSCGNGPKKKQLKTIEGLTKSIIAYNQLLVECYDSAYYEMKNVLDNGEITAKGYKGEGIPPKQVISNLENQKKNLNEAFEAFDLSSDFQINQIEDSINRQWVNKLMKRTQKISVVFSDFTPVKTTGDTKMWTFTELNTGYEFTATSNDERVEISLTDEGLEKRNDDLQKHMKVYDLYDDFEETVKYYEKEAIELARRFWGF